MLRPPVEPMLARAHARDQLPTPGTLPGDPVIQPKFDGYRALVFTPFPGPGPVLIQSRRGSVIQFRFPDLARAAAQLPDGLVLDGELVVWDGDQLSFEALQRRAASSGRTAQRLAEELPAHFIAFDVLQIDGTELLREPYAARRAALEELFTRHRLTAPWTLRPQTSEVKTAQEWLTSWTEVSGLEGIVIKGGAQRYLPGVRGWFKIRRRDTTEAIVGGITGSPDRPRTAFLGRYDQGGTLRLVARTTPLHPEVARGLSERLTAAGPAHPWAGARFTTSWGSRTPLDVILVEPDTVTEIDVDTARDRGAWRHPVGVLRIRYDMRPGDVAAFDEDTTQTDD